MKITSWHSNHEVDDLIAQKKITDFLDDILFEDIRNIVIQEIKTHGYKISGHTHQNSCIPVIDNKYLFLVSLRSWGRIMADAYNKHDMMSYTDWAWDPPENEILPQ